MHSLVQAQLGAQQIARQLQAGCTGGGGLNCWKADPGATFVQNPSPITVLSGIAQEGEEEGEDSTGKLSFLATFCTCLRLLLLKFY